MRNLKNYALASLVFFTTIFSTAQTIPIGQPINMGTNEEYNPSLSGNGRTIIFEQLYFNESKPTIQISYQKNGIWSRPEVLAGANSDIPSISNGGFFLSQAGNIVLFHSSRYGGLGNNDIWIMEKNIIGNWGAPKNPAKPINSPLHEIDPSLSPDGKYLYFTRIEGTEKTPEGNPCGKIYVSERVGKDNWKAPVALPDPINKGCECAGKMLLDNKTFIFASMRSGGNGGYDIYSTKLKADGTWEEPLPYSFINTSKDERYVSVPSGGGLVYHTIENGGNKDIARTVIPENLQPEKITLLQGSVKNETNNLVLLPKVIVTNTTTNKSYTYIGALDGGFAVPVPQDDVYDVAIMANEGKFLYKTLLFKPSGNKKYEEKIMDVKLTPATANVKFQAQNLAFVNNSDTLENFSMAEINRIYLMMRLNITMQIEIGVHTNVAEESSEFKPGFYGKIIDTLGTMEDSTHKTVYDLKITYTNDNTKDQAKALYDILVKKGIAAERIIPVGYGNKYPLSPPPADKALHRRVEITVIKE